jgi:hypothetical protein
VKDKGSPGPLNIISLQLCTHIIVLWSKDIRCGAILLSISSDRLNIQIRRAESVGSKAGLSRRPQALLAFNSQCKMAYDYILLRSGRARINLRDR